jgi:hypothetical protein
MKWPLPFAGTDLLTRIKALVYHIYCDLGPHARLVSVDSGVPWGAQRRWILTLGIVLQMIIHKFQRVISSSPLLDSPFQRL